MRPRTVELIDTAVIEATTERIVSGVVLDYPLTVKAKPGFETACWTFDRTANRHFVWIGEESANELPPDFCKTDADRGDKFKALFRHELGHAEFTHKDLKAANEMCTRVGVDFQFFNLVEDARIEHMYREAHGVPFEWLRYEPVTPPHDPITLLYAMVQHETAGVEFEDAAILERVQDYYARITACTHSLRLEPILRDWVAEFTLDQTKMQQKDNQQDQQGQQGQGQGQPGQGGGSGDQQGEENKGQSQSGQGKDNKDKGEGDTQNADAKSAGQGSPNGKDLANSLRLADANEREKFDENTKAVGQGHGAAERPEDLEQDAVKPGKGKGGGGLSPIAAGEVDWEIAGEIAATLLKAMQGTVINQATATPSKRLNQRSMAGGPMNGPSKDYLRKTLIGDSTLKVAYIVDCSGSMGGDPIGNAKTMAAALCILSERNRASGTIILTATGYHQAIDLRDREGINAIHAFGCGEGLVATIKQYEDTLKQMDAVLVCTDAMLTDGAVDKKRLNDRGIYTTGLYVGHEEQRTELNKYFDASIVRENVQDIAFALYEQFARAGTAKERATQSPTQGQWGGR